MTGYDFLDLLASVKLLVMVRHSVIILATVVAGVCGLLLCTSIVRATDATARLITVFDRGDKSVFLTHEKTVKAALQTEGYSFDARDLVEPSRDEELVAPNYQVNIYRARPVTVIDGAVRSKVVSPYQTARHIAKDAGITLYPEDTTTIKPSEDFAGNGAGLELTITRATPFSFDLYGRVLDAHTQAKTVGDMLKEKKITLDKESRVSPDVSTLIVSGMSVRVWKEGVQTITTDEAIPFTSEYIFDADREIGYRHIKTAGENGNQSVSYEIEIKDGKEIARKELARITTKQPKKETVLVGVKPNAQSLTKAKGAQYFTDSKGVTHRETYYDLDMGVVMRSCGQGGYYIVRSDGVKVDAEGYVLIAANYSRYPKCSIVETSVGPGKVYDTGGFAAVHPDGFDLATDWTNYDGR